MAHSDASRCRVVVIGAGIGGLVSAVELARCGLEVHVFERAQAVGGKMRQVHIGDATLDAGPTVLTMRWVFDQVFAAAGKSFGERVALKPLDCIARHTWQDSGVFDLWTDRERSIDAIGRFFGSREAKGYRRFCDYAATIYREVEGPFLSSQRPSMLGLVADQGLRALQAARAIDPFRSIDQALRGYFRDPRLLQLFGRYATYVGSSPYLAPATLNLIAHVEREGVWKLTGGMHALACSLASLAEELGATLHLGRGVKTILSDQRRARGVELSDGERVDAGAVVSNAEVSALCRGDFGDDLAGARAVDGSSRRSHSALTWNALAETSGFPLAHHTVFFSSNYPREFDALAAGRLPGEPTVYICCQDRDDRGLDPVRGRERLLLLVNAPAWGDNEVKEELDRCEERMLTALMRCGLRVNLEPNTTVRTSPRDFGRLFPGSQGALYGGASHGWKAFFERPSARSRIPGLYITGADAHPGAGVPMAALSGRLAAQAIAEDLDLTSNSLPVAMRGGTLTRSPTAAEIA